MKLLFLHICTMYIHKYNKDFILKKSPQGEGEGAQESIKKGSTDKQDKNVSKWGIDEIIKVKGKC